MPPEPATLARPRSRGTVIATIAIVGAGFSGTLLALQLLRRCPPHARIALIERGDCFGRGVAYATTNPNHLLNVPAGRMGAFPDRPRDFLDWLRRQPPERLGGLEPTPFCFAPRRLFGAYVGDLLHDALRNPATGGRLLLQQGAVTRIERGAGPLRLHCDHGGMIVAEQAVLALGNAAPLPLPGADLWTSDGFDGLDPSQPVLLIGTGLTMVDAVISLLDRGHAGPIHALSRRGLLPRRHAAATAAEPTRPPTDLTGPVYPTGLLALTRALRQHVDRMATAGGWQHALEAIRPHVSELWQALPLADRARFLRHLRPWWNVHRHRLPGPAADRLDAARRCGQLQIHAGRLLQCGPGHASFRPRGGGATVTLPVARAVNCTGPDGDLSRSTDPLLRRLLAEGAVRADALCLGLDVTDACALLDRDGAASHQLFAVGPATRGRFWEITSVPDLRRQCALLAEHLAGAHDAGARPRRAAG